MLQRPPTPTLFPYTTLFRSRMRSSIGAGVRASSRSTTTRTPRTRSAWVAVARSEEHTSELQSHVNLVCRLLLEKKKYISYTAFTWLTIKQRTQLKRDTD